jgi:hypothetical protein
VYITRLQPPACLLEGCKIESRLDSGAIDETQDLLVVKDTAPDRPSVSLGFATQVHGKVRAITFPDTGAVIS